MKIFAVIRDSVKTYVRHFSELLEAFVLELALRGICLVPLLFLLLPEYKDLAWLSVPLYVLIALPARQNYALALQDMLHGGTVLSPRLISTERYFFKLWRGLIGTVKMALWAFLLMVMTVTLLQLAWGKGAESPLSTAVLRVNAMQERGVPVRELLQVVTEDTPAVAEAMQGRTSVAEVFGVTLQEGEVLVPLSVAAGLDGFQMKDVGLFFDALSCTGRWLFNPDVSDVAARANDGFKVINSFGVFSASGKSTDGMFVIIGLIAALACLPMLGCAVHCGVRHAVALDDKKLLRGCRLKLAFLWLASLVIYVPFLVAAMMLMRGSLKELVLGLGSMVMLKTPLNPELMPLLYKVGGAFVLLAMPLIPLKQLLPAVAMHQKMRSEYKEIETDAQA